MTRLLAVLAALACTVAAAPSAHADPGNPADEDLTPPVITITLPPGDAAGWYDSAPAISVRATDNHVGATGVQLVSWRLSSGTTVRTGTVPRLGGGTVTPPDGTAHWTLAVEAVDLNGNTATAAIPVGVDQDRPTVMFDGELRDGRWFGLGSTVAADYTCADAHSGIATCTGTRARGAAIDTSTLGYRTFTATGTDRVGTIWSQTIGYTVVENAFTVLDPPTVPVAQVGREVTATAPRVVPVPDRVEYQWQRGGQDIAGATGATYRPTAADAGAGLRVVATAHKTGFTPRSEPSAAVAVALGTIDAATPVLGLGTRDGTLVASVALGAVVPASAAVSYQWSRDGSAVTGAVGPELVVDPTQLGSRFGVRITLSATGYTPRTLAPVDLATEARELFVSGPAAQRGTARVGQVLTGMAPDITEPHPLAHRAGGDPARLAWQWLRDGRPIPGATSFRYRLQPADAGRRVSVRITGTAPGYEPVALTSPATAAVARATASVRTALSSPRSGTGRLAVTVAVPGVVRPGGTLAVRRGSRVVGRTRVVGPRTVLTLARQPRGRVTYTVTYAAAGVASRSVRVGGRIH